MTEIHDAEIIPPPNRPPLWLKLEKRLGVNYRVSMAYANIEHLPRTSPTLCLIRIPASWESSPKPKMGEAEVLLALRDCIRRYDETYANHHLSEKECLTAEKVGLMLAVSLGVLEQPS